MSELILPSGVKLPFLPPQLPLPQPTTKTCFLMGADAMMVEEADGVQAPRILLRLMAEDGSMVNAVPNNAGDVLRDLTAGRAFVVHLEDRTSATATALAGIGPHISQQVDAAGKAMDILAWVKINLLEQGDDEGAVHVEQVLAALQPLARPSLGRHYHEDDTDDAEQTDVSF